MKKKSLYIAGICAALSVGALGCASSAKAGDEENKTAVEDTKAAGETTAAETSESNTVIEKNAPSGPVLIRTFPNHMALLNCENNIIDVSSLNNTLVAHISHDIIKDYLRFLNKDLSQIPVWQRSATPILTLPCLTPDVFRVAAQHSMMPAETESEKERTRALLFTVLSRFLDSKKFVSLMMYMLRNCVSDSVYQIIESDIHKDWNLSMVASCLCLSPSLLKKKLKSENTSYSQIITTCRMRYAVNELMMDGKNISQVSQSCGYNSTSYFISVFKDFYGMTPLHYVSQHRERTVA